MFISYCTTLYSLEVFMHNKLLSFFFWGLSLFLSQTASATNFSGALSCSGMFCNQTDLCANISGIQSSAPWNSTIEFNQCHMAPDQYQNPYHITSFEQQYSKNQSFIFTAPIDWESKDYPIFVLIHGGGWVAGDKSEFKFLADFLAQRGFKVFSISYTLANLYSFDEAKTLSAPINDVSTFLSFLDSNASKFAVRSANISIVGASAGGLLALYEATHPTKNISYQCAISIAGPTQLDKVISDLELLNWNNPDFKFQRTQYLQSLLDAVAPTINHQTKFSVLDAAKNLNAKHTFAIHNTYDYLVSYQQSVRFINRAQSYGKNAQLITFSGFEFNDLLHGLSTNLVLDAFQNIALKCN